MRKPRWLKSLSEKITHGKNKYATMLVPGIGEWVYSDLFKEQKKLRYTLVVGLATARVSGLIGIATGNFDLSLFYYSLTFGEEFGTATVNYLDARKEKKNELFKNIISNP